MANRYLTTLKDIKGNIIYPQTKANVVLFSTDSGLTVEFKLNELSDRIDSISQGKTTFVGYYDSEEKLKDAYPENITDDESLERKGYYAIIKVEDGNDLLYIWDIGDKKWVKVGTAVSGIQKVNGQVANELGEVIVSGSDINSTANNETKTITEHLQILYNTTEEQEITDTLTLSKEIVVPEVPAVEGVVIDSIETVGDYGFEEVDGWYQNTNQNVDSSYCYSKITFTVPRDMDIIFDINQDSEMSCDFGIFSNLNSDLTQDTNNDGNNVYGNFISQSGDLSLTYSNITTGQYYITVKYIKDGSAASGSDTFKFKLNDSCKGQEYVPSHTYTSEQSITIGDENNLQIEGKDILKEGDVQQSVIELEGTTQNPIILNELEVGLYSIKGNIKLTKDSNVFRVVTWCFKVSGYIDSMCFISVTHKNSEYTEMFLLNADYQSENIIVASNNMNPFIIATRVTIYNYGGISNRVFNLNNYPERYELETLKTQLTNKIDSIKIIESLDTPTEATAQEYKNIFVNSTDVTDKSIYYGKKTGEEVQTSTPIVDTYIEQLYLKKDIVTNFSNYFSNLSEGANYLYTLVLYTATENQYNAAEITLELSNSVVTRIFDSWGNDLYNSSNGWTSNSGSDDELYDLTEHFKTYLTSDHKYIKVYDYSNRGLDTLTVKQITEIIQQVQLALKEDLDNVSVNDVAISSSNTKFALSTSSTELSTENQFVTKTSNTTVRMRGCAYGNDIFVVVGTDGKVEYSTDNGETWILSTNFTDNVIVSIAYGGGYFICVDSAGGIFRSSNITTWETLESPTTDILNSVTYANGKFALVGANGVIAFSNNAETFELVTSGITNELTSICRGLDKYVAVSTSGDILTSINGKEWTNVGTDTTHYRTVTFGQNMFVIGGASGTIKYSNDALTWNTATTDSTSTVGYIREIKYYNGKFYAVMYLSDGTGEIWTSLDGITWNKTQNTTGRLWCLGYGNDRLVTSGDNGEILVLNLNITWYDKEPEIESGKVLWSKTNYYLTDGTLLEGEVETHINIKDMPVYLVDDYVTYTLYNADYPTGIYLSNGRAGRFYYGHQGYSASSNYMITLPVGYAIILIKTREWDIYGGHGGYNFTIFDGSTKIIKGNMGVYSSRKWEIEFPPLNKNGYVPKITDANGTMEWVAPEYYTKAQTNTLLDNTVDLDSIQTITGVKTFTEQVGIANTDGTVDYIKHINNNFLVSTSEGTNLLNIDEELNTVSVMNDKVLRASDFDYDATTFTLNINLD